MKKFLSLIFVILFFTTFLEAEEKTVLQKSVDLVNSAKEIVVNKLEDIKLIEEEKRKADELEKERIAQELEKKREQEAEEKRKLELEVKTTNLLKRISTIDEKLKDNILLKRYSNYDAYRKISEELEDLKKNLEVKNGKSQDHIYHLKTKLELNKMS